MQNMDFYNGNGVRNVSPQFNTQDPEYFSRTAATHSKEDEKGRKKAIRIIFLIAALCIVTFTTGLAIGIKFAGGPNRQIVDSETIKTVSTLKSKVSQLLKSSLNVEKINKDTFPIEKYPYVIKIGQKFNKEQSKNIANYLSSLGHTVILSRGENDSFKIYTGPYKNSIEAENSLNGFRNENRYSINRNVKIIKRVQKRT